jgi:hypothetical protein
LTVFNAGNVQKLLKFVKKLFERRNRRLSQNVVLAPRKKYIFANIYEG